jgi:putative transposase
VVHAWVILPEYHHCVMEVPPDDADFAMRWRLSKMGFSKSLPPKERRSKVRQKRGGRGNWQRRYWEHLIRDEADYRAHIYYVHFNPVKHGWVSRVSVWPYPTILRLVEQGVYPPDWAGGNENLLAYDD